ncbi:hypothetical protein EV426DRAFT_721103 [Tirmania nivea]|nr:hypothetical protein EV426DRAFT_721103 [Tirmania nivea]
MLPTPQPTLPVHERILDWLALVPENPTSKHIHPHALSIARGGRPSLKCDTPAGHCPHSPPATASDADMSTPDATRSKKRPAASSISHQHHRIRSQPGNPSPPNLDAVCVSGALLSTSIPESEPASAPASVTSFDRLTQDSLLIFPPSPPSPRKSSPTKSLGKGIPTTTSRYLRAQLLGTTPKIHLGSPYHDGDPAPHLPPSHVTSIVKRFKEIIFGGGYIPELLKPILDIYPSCAMEIFPPHVFTGMELDIRNAKALLTHVISINSSALKIFARNEDESSWYPIVRSILCGPSPAPLSASTIPDQIEDLISYFTAEITTPAIALVEVCEAQTKLLDQALLPKLNGRRIANGKVDYVVQLNHRHPLLREVRRLRQGKLELNEGENELWSVLGDISVAGSPTVVPVEVKGLAGEYGEGGYQVGLAGVALLTRMVTLAGRVVGDDVAVDENRIPPVPVVVVLGHAWFLHWMFIVDARDDVGVDDGQDAADEEAPAGEWEVVQMGPIYMGSTESVAEVFRLCKVVEKLKEWAGERGQEGFLGLWRDLMVGAEKYCDILN